jgi:hypothetical protein
MKQQTASDYFVEEVTRAWRWVVRRLTEPQPIVRLEWIRILAPLAVLGFMASRIAHPDDWISTAGFRIPDVPDDYRQPIYFSGLSPAVAWIWCALLVVSGLMTSAGAFTRVSAAVFSITLAYCTLADRMATFTVSKLGTAIAVVLVLTPAGTRYSIDAWRRARRDPSWIPPELCSWGNVRFFQIGVPIFYFASGLAKAKGDWLSHRYLLWTQLHDSYQTWVSFFAANHLPPWAWTGMQATTLAFEIAAPLWFAFKWTRPFALLYGVMMHALIGMMFGPVVYFGMLMIILLVGAFAPVRLLAPSFGLARKKRISAS